MAERNENSEHNSSRTNNNEDDVNHFEYPPNVVRFDPDIGLGNQQSARKRRSSGGHPRREESSISFRHFLQSEAGHSSNTTYPDLYSCSRQEGPLVDGSIVDPESPDLPDFVQDHLALENTYFNDGTNLKSVNVHNLPDFAPCLLRDENSEPHLYQRPDREPQANASSSLPFDLTTPANVLPNACNLRSSANIEPATSGSGRLPDFLSDGHVLAPTDTRHREVRVAASENNIELETTERHNLVSMLRHENERLRDELSVLQSVLTKKDDRIKELEDLVTALEISKLQMSTDAITQTSNEMCASQKASGTELATASSRDVPQRITKQPPNSILAERMQKYTSSSEQLLRELLKLHVQMQQDIIQNDKSGSSAKRNSDDDTDDAACGSTSTV
ncbi:hypothetical protein V9T40_005630 [Parthenolecanium corni]|uniref:Endosome-associated-trafficking regulator 1 n=1 Tax=Parthenolecanium corni TaxID=536013 RepID=A0AAN9YAN8_9HEMI